MTWLARRSGRLQLRLAAGIVLGAFVTIGCAPALPDGQYPKVELRAQSFKLRVVDARAAGAQVPPKATSASAGATVDVPFPTPEFTEKAQARLTQLQGKSGIPLTTEVSVKRAQMTLFGDVSGSILRFQVQLTISVTTPSGARLSRGTSSGWRELPERASEAELGEAYLNAAMAAFDEYFGSQKTLDSLKLELDSFLKSHPQ